MSIFLIIAQKDGRRWLVCHAYAGPAVFLGMDEAQQHLDAIRATGVVYSLVEIPADQMKDLK